MDVSKSLFWNLYVELRKEIVATQALRSRAIEFKITIVGTAVALFIANREKIGDDRLLVLPALAAIFFDFLIGSYSFAVKRKGRYLREYVERRLHEEFAIPSDHLLWEEHLAEPEQRQMFSAIANLGLTVLALAPALFVLGRDPFDTLNAAAIVVLLVLFVCIASIYGHLDYFAKLGRFRWARRKAAKPVTAPVTPPG